MASVTQMKLDGDGMQYVIQLSDGKYIVIDGGVNRESDVVRLYDYLTRNVARGEKPVIASWMFTHSDPDHIQLATYFIATYAKEVEILSFAYNFPDITQMDTIQNDEAMLLAVQLLEENIKEYYPNAEICTLYTGESLYFPGVEIEILLTQEESNPQTARTYNETSAAWRMKFDNGKTILFLGDCMQEQCAYLAKRYGEYIKSDMLQLAHHGLIGGDLKLYQLVDPEICFWSTDVERFNGTYARYKYKYCMGEGGCDYNEWLRDEKIRKRKHYHNGATTTILI